MRHLIFHAQISWILCVVCALMYYVIYRNWNFIKMASASYESDSGFIAQNPVQLNEYDMEPESPTAVYNPSRKRTGT